MSNKHKSTPKQKSTTEPIRIGARKTTRKIIVPPRPRPQPKPRTK